MPLDDPLDQCRHKTDVYLAWWNPARTYGPNGFIADHYLSISDRLYDSSKPADQLCLQHLLDARFLLLRRALAALSGGLTNTEQHIQPCIQRARHLRADDIVDSPRRLSSELVIGLQGRIIGLHDLEFGFSLLGVPDDRPGTAESLGCCSWKACRERAEVAPRADIIPMDPLAADP